MLRPNKADKRNVIENRVNEWKVKQRNLEEDGEAPLRYYREKALLITTLLVNKIENLLKSVATKMIRKFRTTPPQ